MRSMQDKFTKAIKMKDGEILELQKLLYAQKSATSRHRNKYDALQKEIQDAKKAKKAKPNVWRPRSKFGRVILPYPFSCPTLTGYTDKNLLEGQQVMQRVFGKGRVEERLSHMVKQYPDLYDELKEEGAVEHTAKVNRAQRCDLHFLGIFWERFGK